MKSSEYLLQIANAELEKKLATTLPVPESIPARDHVMANIEAIKRAREAGWSIKQIHAEFEAFGMPIEFHTFRKYVSDYAPLRKVGHKPREIKPALVLTAPPLEATEAEETGPAPRFSSRFRSAGL